MGRCLVFGCSVGSLEFRVSLSRTWQLSVPLLGGCGFRLV